MIITYLIGNGFDLACGLKTRYTDVYDKYCITDSPNKNIENFKKTILKDNYKNWTDFEMALPEFGKELNDFEKFRECVQDFLAFLEDYLIKEQAKIDIKCNNDILSNKMKSYIYHFYEYCLQNSKSVLKKLVEETNENVTCRFITFNYTDTLEKCLSTVSEQIPKQSSFFYRNETPIHIHHKLNDGILLGLDNEEIYKNIPCHDIRRLENLIDKIIINKRYSDIIDVSVNKLTKSRIIIIFGWSMGESDSFWVRTVKRIFSENSLLHLVYVPYYPESTNKRFRNQPLDREDEQKDFIIKKFGIPEKYHNRVHIVTNTEYMKLDFLANSSNEAKELVDI
mgnify:CR=1 FL=1